MLKTIRPWLIGAAFCVVLVPVAVFLGGWLLAGPYEGEGGVFGLMLRMYGDALTLDAKAWLLLLSPLLLAGIGTGCLRLSRLAAATGD